MKTDEGYELIKGLIETGAANDPKVRSLLDRIAKGDADFKTTSEYSRIVSEILGTSLSEHILDLDGEAREEVCRMLLHDRYEDINDVLAEVQTSLDAKTGINIRPKKPPFQSERVASFAHSLADLTVADQVIKRRAKNGSANISMSDHDRYMKANAELRNKAGLKCYIERETDGKCCEWCTKMAGRYAYPDDTPKDVFRRHDNCGCTVTYKNGRQRQDVWSKKTWEADKDERISKASGKEPTAFSKAEAQAKQSEILARKELTYGAKGGIIQARGYQDNNFNRKAQLSTADEDLKAVNPNYGRISGYDDNCQRCVPTYVLRKQGYDVEALPTGQNETIDNLLKHNPYIIWQKAGSPVIPKSTRGSSYFGKPEIEKYMKDLPDGAMCEIQCQWAKENYGHVFIAEKVAGEIRYIDPQNNNSDVSSYFKKMKYNRTTFWRIDDANLNDDLIKYCCKSRG